MELLRSPPIQETALLQAAPISQGLQMRGFR